MNYFSISVVIPLYNKGLYIKRALDSVLAQTYQNFELIVVNDGSTDESAEAVKMFTDPRIRLIHQENGGECAARNRGIYESRADLIAFLDADDEWMPEHLETLLRLSQNFPECGAYATAYDIVDITGCSTTPNFFEIPEVPWEGIIPRYFRSALCSPPVCSSAVAVWKKVFNEVGLFPVGEKRGGDLETWARIALKYPIAFNTNISAHYWQNSGNRVCLTIPDPLGDRDNALFKTLKHAVITNNYRKEINKDDLIAMVNKLALIYSRRNIDVGEKKIGRTFLKEVSLTRSTYKTLIKYYILSFIPDYLSPLFLNVKRKLWRS